MAAPASRARQENFSRSRICPLGGLVLRTHSGVSDDGYGPIHAEGLADRFAAEEPPFPKLSLVRRNFQALRLPTTVSICVCGGLPGIGHRMWRGRFFGQARAAYWHP